MMEVEIKCRIRSREEMRQTLVQMGFVWKHRIRETDEYYDNAAGEIRGADGALRIRIVEDLLDGSRQALTTLKGKKVDAVSMTRSELETGVSDGVCMGRIYRALGYAPVEPKVVKIREEYTLEDATACLDLVEGLGDFLELEILVEDEKDPEAKSRALQRLEAILERTGYRMEDTVTKSYLSMLQRPSLNSVGVTPATLLKTV